MGHLLIKICALLGIPLAIEKVDGPATVLEFLEILLDTERMEARLPQDKFESVKATIKECLYKKNATRQKFSPWLQHAAKVVRPGWTFVSHMYSTAAKGQELDYFTRIIKQGIPIRPILVACVFERVECFIEHT